MHWVWMVRYACIFIIQWKYHQFLGLMDLGISADDSRSQQQWY
jgi:hypothetical protein